uniref:Uncharacterized protein n=1 Tax=Pseudo-nitzschia australis TaxID=44445 RepID=A0A7S4AE30_9STRA
MRYGTAVWTTTHSSTTSDFAPLSRRQSNFLDWVWLLRNHKTVSLLVVSCRNEPYRYRTVGLADHRNKPELLFHSWILVPGTGTCTPTSTSTSTSTVDDVTPDPRHRCSWCDFRTILALI